MGRFLYEFTEFSGEVPSGAYIPISVSGDTYNVKKEILQSGIVGGGASSLADLSDVLIPSPSNGETLIYSSSGYWYSSIASSLELQYTGIVMTGTMSTSSTSFVNVLSGNLTLLSNSSKIQVHSIIMGQSSSISAVGWFRIMESNLTSGTSGVVFCGDNYGSRTPVAAGVLLKSSDPALYPVPILGFGIHSGQAGDQMAYTIQVKSQNAINTIYINRGFADSDSSAFLRGQSTLIIKELI